MTTELKPLIARLNATCRKAFEKSAELCVTQTHYTIEIEHLLLKLIEPSDNDVFFILKHYEISTTRLTNELTRTIERFKRGNERTPAMSPYIITLLREAWLITSLQFNGQALRSGALLLAIIDHDALRGSLIETLPTLFKIPRESLRQDLADLVEYSTETEAITVTVESDTSGTAAAVQTAMPALDQYTINLTEAARAGKLDPITGRDAEIRQLIDILTRRRQNNPILTGHAGVGKTAIVEGLALKITQGEVPPILRQVSVRVLDLGLLQAGAGVKGEFENRFKSIINEIKAALNPVILFIDEAHTLIGAGGPSGQSDAANLLKPALARGELRTIAATTWSEYKTYFEKDKALTRRFQVIKVEEPSEDMAITMLRGIVPNLEKHHHVRVLDEAIRDAVRLSHRYISDRYLPDKAISVLDTACARVAIAQNSTPPVLEAILNRITRRQKESQLLQREQDAGMPHQHRLQHLTTELTQLEELKNQLDSRWQAELTVVKQLREIEERLTATTQAIPADLEAISNLQTELAAAKQQLETLQTPEPMIPIHVDSHLIATVISGWTGIPLGKMVINEITTILNMEEKMAERLVGQDQALEMVARRIQTSRASLDDPKKPIGVFLLVGPSGVGKTETALTLADLLYGGEHHVVTINMSEYQEAHTISALRGSPPGYVGYGKGGILTEAVRRNPYSVVLLDEIEKAHPDVMELFYQVFDKGTLEDGEGAIIDFKNTLILLTSNVGTEIIMRAPKEWDVEQLQDALRPELLRYFQAGFLGRLIVIPYYALGDEEIYAIVKLKLAKVQQRFVENHHAKFTYDDNLVTAIANRCTEVDSGARNIDHILTDTILPALAIEILKRIAQGQNFTAVHLGCDEEGNLNYEFKVDTTEDEVIAVDTLSLSQWSNDLPALLEWLKSA
ncbi:MAG: type VI secretion system ATPase TssH [Thioploca sp.]|nr:type VI secretion system ATPase TssH [Thioploca sp.]